MTGEAKLKGWHVLAMLIGFFGTVIAVNAVFVILAVRSFPGQEEAKPYLQGLRFNDEIARRSAEEALGWTAMVRSADRTADGTRIVMNFRDRAGSPLLGLAVTGELRRPTHDGDDFVIVFNASGGGAYAGIAPASAEGLWDLVASATSMSGETFAARTRLVLK